MSTACRCCSLWHSSTHRQPLSLNGCENRWISSPGPRGLPCSLASSTMLVNWVCQPNLPTSRESFGNAIESQGMDVSAF
eukprot:6122642-Lingulodinium_polyedra.AAC.1